jgi:hypothetical protein
MFLMTIHTSKICIRIQSIPRIRCPGAGHSRAHLPQQSTAEQLKRNVSFRPTVTVHPVEKLANNKDARSRMYLSKEETNKILNKNRTIQLSSKETHTSFEHGTVGLHADSLTRCQTLTGKINCRYNSNILFPKNN